MLLAMQSLSCSYSGVVDQLMSSRELSDADDMPQDLAAELSPFWIPDAWRKLGAFQGSNQEEKAKQRDSPQVYLLEAAVRPELSLAANR